MKTVEKILRKLAPFRVNGVSLTSNFRNMGGGVWRIGKLVLVNMYCYVPNTFSKNDYYTVATGLPEANIDSALSVTTSNSGGNREANAIVSTGGSLVVQTGNDFDLTNYTIYITGIYLAGGGIVEHAFCAISSLVRRWSHEQETDRSAYNTRDRESHQILWYRDCVGLIFFVRSMGAHLPVWNHLFCYADSDLLKGRECSIAIEHHSGGKDHYTGNGKLFNYDKHKERRLDCNRQDIAVALERGCC